MMRLETRSLPGSNIATQTEMHAGTQTTNSSLWARGGSDCGRRSRGYDERDCSKSANYPRRSSSMPRRHMFNSPIIEETGSGSGASSGPQSANAPMTASSGSRSANAPMTASSGLRPANALMTTSISGPRSANAPISTRIGPRSANEQMTASSGSVRLAVGAPPSIPLFTGGGRAGLRRQQFVAMSSTSSSTEAAAVAVPDGRRSRSTTNLRELDLDRQLQYMTPSLRSRALARRRLSTSLPVRGDRDRPPPRAMQMLEKKSVFTIAYGDVATQKINCSADSSTINWD